MINKKIFVLLLIMLISNNLNSEEKISISYKINNELVTNIDIEKEKKYLLALNDELKNLKSEKILLIATDSIIRENIKKIELKRFYDINKKNEYTDGIFKGFYTKLGMNNEEEFEIYLKKNDLELPDVRTKITIEALWNELIYTKYKDLLKIDIETLKKKITEVETNSYFLSEIIFEKSFNESLEEKFNKIKTSIKEIGFKNTATIYSVSDSAKFGGNIGWINEKSLSPKIIKEITNIEVGEYSSTIKIGNNFLILQVEKIKKIKSNKDAEVELQKLINYAQNRQLKQFSKIYYNKIKTNTTVNEQ